MDYIQLGRTGLNCSVLSFGGIPIQRSDAANTVSVVDALEQHGINFIDTARGYTVSEEYLGAALEGRREKFILATKSMSRDYAGMKQDVETSLANLRTPYIDLYQLHNLPLADFDTVFSSDGALRALREAKSEGKIGHIGVTLHSLDALKRVVEEDDGTFETVMFPYSIVELHGHDTLLAAREKGIGVICMKPLAGGNLEDADLALRFVSQSGAVHIAIPGMGSAEEVERNAAVFDRPAPLTPRELERCETIRRELGSRFCRRCGYCLPCAKGIHIPNVFTLVNYLRNYQLADWAKLRYDAMPHHANECVGCGLCETRCPYELPIREMLRDVVRDFGY